jgi:hypothetical protein
MVPLLAWRAGVDAAAAAQAFTHSKSSVGCASRWSDMTATLAAASFTSRFAMRDGNLLLTLARPFIAS